MPVNRKRNRASKTESVSLVGFLSRHCSTHSQLDVISFTQQTSNHMPRLDCPSVSAETQSCGIVRQILRRRRGHNTFTDIERWPRLTKAPSSWWELPVLRLPREISGPPSALLRIEMLKLCGRRSGLLNCIGKAWVQGLRGSGEIRRSLGTSQFPQSRSLSLSFFSQVVGSEGRAESVAQLLEPKVALDRAGAGR